MAEKYFIITSESKHRQEYINYRVNSLVLNEIVKKFMLKHSIETTKYYPTKSRFYIYPTESDSRLLKEQLCISRTGSGSQQFKLTSKIAKDWIEIIEPMEILYQPRVPDYFKGYYGRTHSRLFQIEDIVYCSFESDNEEEIETPSGFIEIKASEFYKAVEDREEQIKKERANEDTKSATA